jgi:dTDP-4-dehydrorhamnose reductase
VKAVVVGASGQLGSDVVLALGAAGYETIPLTHEQMEISDAQSVADVLGRIQPAVVVNTAAMHHVEKCEADPERAHRVNAIGARNLAMVTRDQGSALVHISTDYVFDGSKPTPYVEGDEPRPLNVYGTSKLAGECYVRAINPRHFVLRTSALYGRKPCRAKGGLNFVELMLKLAREKGEMSVVDSERVSPTATAELAEQVAVLSKTEAYGLYHATAEGSCSWYEFAREILSVTGTAAKLNVAAPGQFPAKVRRPQYSVLENAALKCARLNCFTPWQGGLRRYLKHAGHTLAAA